MENVADSAVEERVAEKTMVGDCDDDEDDGGGGGGGGCSTSVVCAGSASCLRFCRNI